MVELRGIRKYFSSNGVKALDGADFNLQEGEIHALVGENGAGKSTLMHIMAGFTKPSIEGNIRDLLKDKLRPGTILVDGKEQRFSSPAQAMAAGIGMVRQHPHHVPGFFVWENCVLGSNAHPAMLLNRRAERERVIALDRYLGFDLPLDSTTDVLTVSQSQKAAILTLLLRKVRYFIFDEPTAVLNFVEAEILFEFFKRLKQEGKGIVLISHKLGEVIKLADRVTVLRRGRTQVSREVKELDSQSLLQFIFGPELSKSLPLPTLGTISGLEQARVSKQTGGKTTTPALMLQNFTVSVPGRPLIRGVDLTVERGAILGIGGVRDSGLETLELAISGFLPASGTIRINGKDLFPGTVRSFRNAGAAYLGTWNGEMNLPIRDVLIVHAHRRFQHREILDQSKLDRWVDSIIKTSKVPISNKTLCTSFSGGQLQRLLITRELAENCSLLVLSEPCRSLDRLYKKKLAALLKEKAAAGTAILIFSTDIDELFVLSDSITVLRNGVFSDTLKLDGTEPSGAVQDRIRKAMVGQV
jgi:ABC-type uncharacterized transport system ATPase subunit